MASYAVILRRSALVTAPVPRRHDRAGRHLGGGKGLVGALLGVGLVIVFFGISAAGDELGLTEEARRSRW